MTLEKDREVLRGLAEKYAGYAASERNKKNKRDWEALNALRPNRPMVTIDQIPWHEMELDGRLALQCTDPFLRQVEESLRRDLYKWELMKSDQTLSTSLEIPKAVLNSGIGIQVNEDTRAVDGKSDVVSHAYVDQLATWEQLERLQTPVITHDAEETARREELVGRMVGDILPVRSVGLLPEFRIWDKIAQFRSITPILMDFIQRPEFMHATARRFTDFELAILDQLEEQNLLYVNPQLIHCSGAHTEELPAPGFRPEHVRARDCWCMGLAQLFSSCSPKMHEEFEMRYAKEYHARVGLVYYGCCEPLHDRVELIRKLPHVRKISMSPWADPFVAAQNIGKDYVLSRKPNPAFLAVDGLDEQSAIREIRETLAACRQTETPCEFLLKDISTVQYEPRRIFRWSEIVAEELQK